MSNPKTSLQGLPRACNEAMILAALAMGPRHGYQMVLDIEARSHGAFCLKHGTLYPILHRLENNGYIKGTWTDGGPKAKRKAYHLTKSGIEFALKQKAELKGVFQLLLQTMDTDGKKPTAKNTKASKRSPQP